MNAFNVLNRLAFGAFLFVIAAHASAADLHVKVIDSRGQPVSDVAVLVTSGSPRPTYSQPPPAIEVRQKGMRFVPPLSVVPIGTSVTFTNEDEFDHHVNGAAEGSRFEFLVPAASGAVVKTKIKARRTPARIVLKEVGIVRVTCLLHSSMRAHIVVTDATHHGITDASGEIHFTGMPDGQAVLNAWHPLMLTRQAATVTALSGTGAQATLKLNFAAPSPRR